MNYFTLRTRRGAIRQFLADFEVFVQSQSPEVQRRLGLKATTVQQALDSVGLGQLRGVMQGQPLQLALNILHEDLPIHPDTIRDQLTMAIGEYDRLLSRAKWQLLNPFWWTGEALAFTVRQILMGVAPLFGMSGLKVEGSTPARTVIHLARLLPYIAAVATIEEAIRNAVF